MSERRGVPSASRSSSEVAVDPGAVAAFLAARLPELDGPFTIARLGEGQSCLTYLVSGTGWEVVLRRPPRGELPRGAFDVVREYRVLSALTHGGTGVPVPRPLALCEDPEVLGVPFYLMERVHGYSVRTTLPPALAGHADRRRMGEALVDLLVALRAIDVGAIGLEGHGRPDGYLARQLRRMGEQREAVRGRALPELDAVGAWLADHVPGSPAPALLHGDLKLDNVILAPASPTRVAAVIDWELSTLGDPLADLGWLLYFWREDGEEPFPIPVANVTHLPGFSRRAELRDRYERLTGAPVPEAPWYAALGGWKIAVIMETSYSRFRAGYADHPTFAALDEGVRDLARRALAFAEGALRT